MKKLSRSQLLLLMLIVAFVGVGIYFIVVAMQQSAAAADLEGQVASTQRQVYMASGQYDIEDLKAQLESLEAELENTAFPVPQEVENVSLLDLVINSRHKAGVQVASYLPQRPTTVTLNNNQREYRSYVHAVNAQSSDISRLYLFLNEVESNAPFKTLVLDRVSLTYVGQKTDEPGYWQMSFNIIVYAFENDRDEG